MKPKIAFITGASRGIGHAIAERFAQQGYCLAINCKNSGEALISYADKLARTYHIPCLPLVGDVSQEPFAIEAFHTIGQKFGGIDILVNNAGISKIGLLSDMSLGEWNQILQVNLTSLFCCCKHAIPYMLRSHSGSILNISSVWGNAGASCEVAYSASKGGANAFTKALAKELAPSGISVNAIACGNSCRQVRNPRRSGTAGAFPCGIYSLPDGTGRFTGRRLAIGRRFTFVNQI